MQKIRNQFATISLLAIFMTKVQTYVYVLTLENSQDLLLEDEFFKPRTRKWTIEMIIYAGALKNLIAQKHICKRCGLPMNELFCKDF
ncbi:hypothetical protein T11_2490 [Trichinella zimbabwensis]|uniref:Uncharacterized protein n=1 Tax=Trichinella zimbabwensis TaxID=268475 RepID=A0A0V1I669_9BILA|nr:hypothetical protein T11_2490 [Trichinella zimbabwensis]